MRIINRLVVAAAVAATAASMAVVAVAPPASADPINKAGKCVQPAPYDVVSVGSESISAVNNQLAFNYNVNVVGSKHSATHPFLYSWDAVPEFPGKALPCQQGAAPAVGKPKPITLKGPLNNKSCTNVRPNGSTAGIGALTSYGNITYKGKTYPCADFARSSRPRKNGTGGDPACAKGGVCFVTLANDAVTYASTNLKGESTNVPNNLSTAQLKEIFGCTIAPAHGFKANTWGALLGPKTKNPTQRTDPIGPQAGSGTLSFWFETALGLTTDTEPTCGSGNGLSTAQQPEENEGTNKIFLSGKKADPNVIYPFSIGSFVAQEFHSAKCGRTPTRTQNMFGCDMRGVLGLNGITVARGKTVAPTARVKGKTVTNPAWESTVFERTLYDVVPFNTTSNPIPGRLHAWLGKGSYFCKQSGVLENYGFEATPFCGAIS